MFCCCSWRTRCCQEDNSMGRPTRPVQGWWPCPTPIPAIPNTCIDKLPQSAMITSFSTCACAGAQIHTQHRIGGLACDTRRTGPHHEDQMSTCAHVRPCALAQGVQSPLAGQIVFRSVLFGAFGAAKRWLSTNADGTVRPLTTADFYKVSLLSSPLKLPCTRTCPVVCVCSASQRVLSLSFSGRGERRYVRDTDSLTRSAWLSDTPKKCIC